MSTPKIKIAVPAAPAPMKSLMAAHHSRVLRGDFADPAAVLTRAALLSPVSNSNKFFFGEGKGCGDTVSKNSRPSGCAEGGGAGDGVGGREAGVAAAWAGLWGTVEPQAQDESSPSIVEVSEDLMLATSNIGQKSPNYNRLYHPVWTRKDRDTTAEAMIRLIAPYDRRQFPGRRNMVLATMPKQLRWDHVHMWVRGKAPLPAYAVEAWEHWVQARQGELARAEALLAGERARLAARGPKRRRQYNAMARQYRADLGERAAA